MDNVVKLDRNVAPRGKLWVCTACGKSSPHRHGGHAETDEGWDSSCMTNAVLVQTDTVLRDERGLVIACDCGSGYGVTLFGVMKERLKQGDR